MSALGDARAYLAKQAASGVQATMHAERPEVLLARLVAEIEGAPKGIGSRDKIGEGDTSIIMHIAIPARAMDFAGKTVRLVGVE